MNDIIGLLLLSMILIGVPAIILEFRDRHKVPITVYKRTHKIVIVWLVIMTAMNILKVIKTPSTKNLMELVIAPFSSYLILISGGLPIVWSIRKIIRYIWPESSSASKDELFDGNNTSGVNN